MPDLNEIERGQLCQTTIESLYEVTGGLKSFPGLLRKIIINKAWERRQTRGRTFELDGLRELITKKPIEGWGEDPAMVEAVIKDNPEVLALYREAMNGPMPEHRRPTASEIEARKGYAVTFTGRGNSNNYWQARIQRDCPGELDAIKGGDKTIMDIRRERGWVSNSKRVSLTGDPAIDCGRLVAAWGQQYVEELVQQ